MKAIVYHKYGSPDVLELRKIAKPVASDDEVLVRIHASSVNPAEWHTMTDLYIGRTQFGLLKPKTRDWERIWREWSKRWAATSSGSDRVMKSSRLFAIMPSR